MSELTHSSKWKSFMNYCYSWGASVVLMGALFKLQHWTGGGTMLTIGMSTEVLIFFLSAFEPSVEIPDWKKVYRQLRPDFIPIDEEDEIPSYPSKQKSIDNIFEKAEITPELLSKVKKGLLDLSNAASGIADISSATLVTNEYVKNMSGASESMASFNDVNTRATHSIEKSTTDLVHSYDQSTQILSNSSKNLAQTFSDSSKKINDELSTTGDKLAQSYKSIAELMSKDLNTLNDQTKTYSAGLSHINTSLSALNSSYELHLQNTKKLSESSAKAFEGYSKMTEEVNNSLEEAQKYRKHTELLNKNLEALNHVYGNMLGAMNVKG
ncbi:MAG TPA: gliding motility protein GldL [Prolixibacteraceae bacterium]|nr:gliding motility protein GldL [Prolixibacteraceae bacterium]